MEVSAMSALVGDLTTVAGEVITQVGAVVDCIVGEPFLLLTTGVLFLGSAIGIMGRMLSRN